MLGLSDGQCADLSLVMVVCSSPINRIVVSRIVEQAGLKSLCETPEHAVEALSARRPGMIVLDCCVNCTEHHPIVPAIVDHRRASGSTLPMLVVLSTKAVPADSLFIGVADAIVPKPITPDALQPRIEFLVEEARG